MRNQKKTWQISKDYGNLVKLLKCLKREQIHSKDKVSLHQVQLKETAEKQQSLCKKSM